MTNLSVRSVIQTFCYLLYNNTDESVPFVHSTSLLPLSVIPHKSLGLKTLNQDDVFDIASLLNTVALEASDDFICFPLGQDLAVFSKKDLIAVIEGLNLPDSYTALIPEVYKFVEMCRKYLEPSIPYMDFYNNNFNSDEA